MGVGVSIMGLKLWRADRGVACMFSDALGAGVRGEAIYQFWQNGVESGRLEGYNSNMDSSGIEPSVVEAMVVCI